MEETMKYEIFFKEIKKFKDKQNEQKQRGLNDYNMVNVVRKENAEVGMHSNVIYSLIDPNGLHYQGNLFLKLFIQEVLTDIKDDFGEIISVDVEESTYDNRRIDFTIKSSNYYIGIEMKIDAKDLKDQLSHYEEDLLKKAEKDTGQKAYIYYLTKDGKEAALDSHNKITYKQVSFEEHILNWINKCQVEVRNITNLNEALENYKDIVKKITNQYKGKVMALEDELLKDEQLFVLAKEVSNAYLKALEKKVKENKEVFFNTLKEQLASYDIEQLNEPKIFIPIKTLDGGILKLQIVYERNELLATLFKDNNGWCQGDNYYNDNENISNLINNTQGMRRIGKYGYFSINLNANVNFEKPVDKQEIEKTRDNISDLLAKLRELDLK